MSSRRRGNGEGSIYRRRSNGRWVGAVTATDGTGRPRRKTVYGATRREVAELIGAGELDVVHIGRCARVPVDALDSLVTRVRAAAHYDRAERAG